jgi:hypothetical protein
MRKSKNILPKCHARAIWRWHLCCLKGRQALLERLATKNSIKLSGFQLCSARDNIPHADEVQTLIKDIWEIRMSKLRKSINVMVEEKETHARVTTCAVLVGVASFCFQLGFLLKDFHFL